MRTRIKSAKITAFKRMLAVVCCLLPFSVVAQDNKTGAVHFAPYIPPVTGVELAEPGRPLPQKVKIYSTADVSLVRDIIADFQRVAPNVAVDYYELQSLELYKRILAESANGGKSADIAFSSAMDLQLKLANDGYALEYSSIIPHDLPSWASWRNEAFGVTFEPAVTIYNKKFFAGKDLPKTHSDLLSLLENQPELFSNRVATYDIAKSGVGFLFLARDSEQYSATWELVRALGKNRVKLLGNSSAIIDGVARGEFVLGYNVLGSYAMTRAESAPDLGVILMQDYTLVFSRIALIPRSAPSPEAGKLFLDYLISKRGQAKMAQTARFNAIHPEINGPYSATTLQQKIGTNLRPIKVSPGLLVYHDQRKREKLLKRWDASLGGE